MDKAFSKIQKKCLKIKMNTNGIELPKRDEVLNHTNAI
jgi:hypothetical protein